ncbi:MAG: WecB/TagA/CpsF family glycosyltransferase [Candidatus Scatovivens sp.]
MQEKISILGVKIDNITLEESGLRTKQLIENSNKSCKIIVAPNTEFVMCAQKDKEFFEILKTAELATPDSIGIILGAKLQNKRFKQRIPGQAYFREVLRMAELEGWSIYILGGTEQVIDKAVINIKKDFPKVNIIGYHEGYFIKDSEEDVIEEINKLKPNVLFVAMGAPKQEKWIFKNRNILKVDVAAGQGGTLDYEAGNIKRAPKFIQKIGMEWLWRLILQPSRIIRMRVLPIFLIKILFKKDKSKGKFG